MSTQVIVTNPETLVSVDNNTVTIESGNQITNILTIAEQGPVGPQGPTGPQGAAGGEILWRGTWSSATAYNKLDAVTYNGSSYLLTVTSSTNHQPDTNADKWALLAQKGNDGAVGATGATGATGPQGPAGQGVPTGGTTGQVLAKNSSTDYDAGWVDVSLSQVKSISFCFDGAGSDLPADLSVSVPIPLDITINEWVLISEQTGSLVIDLRKDSYANYPPTIADTITGSEKPTLTAQNKNKDSNLTTWSTSLSAGDVLTAIVESASSVQKAVLQINGIAA